jgi:hypothetical protein
MSSGRVQLTSVGIQDQFLTGDPDVTYFIKKYNRHTKFALEILNVPFYQTNIDFGSWVNVEIPRNGQLIRTLYVRLVLPALSVGGYTNGIGNAIIEHADLVIGGQTVERINGEYMQIYDETFISDSQQDAFTYMVGTTNKGLYGLGPASAYQPGLPNPAYGWYPRTFMVPLPFFFNRNEALSIPLCALTRQEVEVRIKFRPLEQLIAGGYLSNQVAETSSVTWFYDPAKPEPTIDGALTSVTWIAPYFACIPAASTSNVYYFDYSNSEFFNLLNLSPSLLGNITCISQNTNTNMIVLSDDTGTNNYTVSDTGPIGDFRGFNIPNISFIAVANDGENFLAIGVNVLDNFYSGWYFQYNTAPVLTSVGTTTQLVSVTWSPSQAAFIIGDINGGLYTYKYASDLFRAIVGQTGPYSTWSPVYGQIYNNSQVAASNTVVSNLYSYTTNMGLTATNPVGTVSIAYSPTIDRFFTLQTIAGGALSNAYAVGFPQTTHVNVMPTPLSDFQASLAVEYVFLADEEVAYLQKSKIDYVITQLQLATAILPSGANQLNGYRTYFINPTKEMFITIQDSNVLPINDYFNYFNTSTGTDQLVNLELQFNGEDIISPTVADNLYLGTVQFLNNHTRFPNLGFYNYSFAIDPENYLPTGQVNMSRISNQNFWINLTPSSVSRTVNIYTKSFNILRVQNGLAGVLFMDNNFI